MPHYYQLVSYVMMDAKPFSEKNAPSLGQSQKLILTGEHNTSDGLWNIPLTPPSHPTQSANTIFQINNIKK